MLKSFKLLPWIISAGIAWSLGYVYNTYHGGLMSWLRAMYENKRAMSARVEAPKRLLIAGGSGAHYTVNSQLIERELGFPVLNLALDGNLGLSIILPLIVEQTRPGDIVLLIPEYLMLLDKDGIGERSAEFAVAIGRPGLPGVSAKELARDTWLLGVPSLRSLTKASIDLIQQGKIVDYYSDPITERGDPTQTWPRQGEWWFLKVNKPVTPHSIEAIAQFRQQVEAKGANLVISLPIIYARQEEKTTANVRETVERLAEVAPLIYDRDTLNLWEDSSLFADTHYHLQPEARITRSRQIVRELKPILADLPSSSQTDSIPSP